MVIWIVLKPTLGGRLNTKLGDECTPNTHNNWFILFYHTWGPGWIETHWNNIRLRARSYMTSHDTWRSVTTLHDFGHVLGRPLVTLFLGSHNFMVTALGSCVKWPSNTNEHKDDLDINTSKFHPQVHCKSGETMQFETYTNPLDHGFHRLRPKSRNMLWCGFRRG